jgi:hypothetical protein
MSGRASNNIFAALQKKKKAAPKPKDVDAPKEEPEVDHHAELEKAIFSSAPATGTSNWADDDSEEEWEARPAPREDEGWNQVRPPRPSIPCNLLLGNAAGC